jgi:membrane protease YdiL (CAAX protease family)
LSTSLRASISNVDVGSSDDDEVNNVKPTRRQTVLPAAVQFAITMAFYGIHMAFLTTNSITFPFQLLPNAKGHFCGITYDSLLGLSALVGYVAFVRPRHIRRQLRVQMMKAKTSSSSGSSDPDRSASPSFGTYQYPWNLPNGTVRWRITSFLALCALVQAYFYAGRFSLFWEDTILNLSGLGFYITAPVSRSLQVLLGHLTWVSIGSAILRWVPRPPKFFRGATSVPHEQHPSKSSGHDSADPALSTDPDAEADSVKSSTPLHQSAAAARGIVGSSYRWFRFHVRDSNWLLWAIGGYCVSSFLFNMADGINQYIIPPSLLLQQETSVVSQLVTPEHNDLMASVLAYIAPCVTAPWWEEVLYRGFLLPVLSSAFGYPIAAFVQAVVFSAHHMSVTAFVPLLVLGYAWGVLYRECQNLWVPVLIHAMWNSRVFFTSWLGI